MSDTPKRDWDKSAWEMMVEAGVELPVDEFGRVIDEPSRLQPDADEETIDRVPVFRPVDDN